MRQDGSTIFAPATAAGKAGVAVMRISGPEAKDVLGLCAPKGALLPRKAVLRKIGKPGSGEIIDQAVVLYFPAPDSFTGEEVIELHTHGGRAVTHALLEALGSMPHFRLAEPGEFTRRAFENGKMDLTEAEAIADLVNAETEAQRKQALRQMAGALGKLYEDWRDRLSHCLAYIEGAIDFSEEELPQDMIDAQQAQLHRLRDEMGRHLDDNHRGERLREGFSVVLLGPPNAGKSSLLNALARRDAAIVSPTAGTTRDLIDVHLDIGGYPVILTDTAGLRGLSCEAGHGAIENEGIKRAKERAAHADLKIVVFDGALWPHTDEATQTQIDQDTLIVVNKADLIRERDGASGKAAGPLFISALTGEGIDALLAQMLREIDARYGVTESPSLTRERHRAALEECARHLDRALQAPQTDMRAEDVRLAMRSLGRITGRVDVEDLLDIIFKDFCIGK